MIDYEKLKFKAGLEIHQQLDSGKLFCDCPSILRSDPFDFNVKRKLHAVAGEFGEVDVAARYQSEKEEDFVYFGHNENSCLVELDEEPPHEINRGALKIGLQIALLLDCEIQPNVQIMRKTVIDGTNVSGFQRTVLIARGGFLKTSRGRVGIDYIYLEEDSARKIKEEENEVHYNLDRLGIPLVEIVTSPDLKNAEHAKEVALKIGEILRSCKVRRGIGTIRQDINISIRGENRVEIKGMQNMDIFTEAVNKEILRQKKLSDSKTPTDMEVRNVLPSGESKFMRPLPGSARMYPETDLPLLRIKKSFIDEIKKNLPKLRSEIENELKKQGLTEEMIKILFKRGKLEAYKELYSAHGDGFFIGKLLLLFPKELASKRKIELEEIDKILNLDILSFILEKVYKDKLHKANVKEVLERIIEGKKVKEAIKFEKVDSSGIEEEIMKLIKSKPGLSPNAYMGLVMKEFKGAISGKEAMEIIKKFVK